MATMQMQKPASKTKNWTALFPEKQLTEVQSMLFVKKLLAVAVSSVSYLRAIFPENAFGERSLEDLKLKILREDNSCPGACHVIQWMKGCFDALDKKYLRMILIGIYENPEDPDTVIEQYTFKFNYNGRNGIDIYRNDTKIMGSHTEEQTKKATIRLLRTLILLSQTLTPLPDDVMMTMKLFYYDEDDDKGKWGKKVRFAYRSKFGHLAKHSVTPADYQPPGFKECNAEIFTFKEEAMNIKVGEVSTPFHSLTLKVGTIHHQLKYKDDEEKMVNEESVCGEETPMLEEKQLEVPRKFQTVIEDKFEDIPDTFPAAKNDMEDAVEEDELPNCTDRIPETYDKSADIATGIVDSTSEVVTGEEEEANAANEDPIVNCHCGVHRDDGLMILCAICDTWQHALCFAIRKTEDAPASHTCATCSKKFDGQACTDRRLEQLSKSELQATCLWRRAMMAVSEMSRVTGNMLMKRLGTEIGIANHIVKRLEKEGYIKTTSKNKRLGKLVDKEKILLHGINTYFRTDYEGFQSDSHESRASCMEEGVEEIVSRASGMELQETATINLDKGDIIEMKKVQKNSRKRAVSTLSQADEFEISNSQDISEIPNELKPSKRLKASAAVHSLLV